MDKNEEFDFEFDFEKEFGFDPKELLGEETPEADVDFDFEKEFGLEPQEEPVQVPQEPEAEFDFSEDLGDAGDAVSDDDLDDLLSDDFLASLGIIREAKAPAEAEPEPVVEDEPYSPDIPEDDFLMPSEIPEPEEEPVAEEDSQEPMKIYVPSSEPAFEVEPELGADFMEAFEKDFPSEDPEVPQPPVKQDIPAETPEQPVHPISKRRRKLSKERIIKEVYLPPIIAGLALILIITFIGSAIGRAVKDGKEQDEIISASNEASSSALQAEADLLMAEASALAAGYDYDAAIAKLETFSGEMSKFQAMTNLYTSYSQARDKLVPFEDYASIPNLSFHGLIADPARAFIDETFGKSYNNNYVTIDEFAKILQQLYNNNYVLVDFDSFIVETTGEDGKVTYSTQPLYLPEGKKPLMLTQTLVNYELFTIDSDGDGEADKGGDGFASKLIVDANGEILNEYVDAEGNTVTGAYDLVPILNQFLDEHPDFSYRGSKAILAVTGEDGVFGYRIMHSVKTSRGEDYYTQQVEGAKKIAQALRDDGYTIACYTYSNISYGELSATKIQADLDAWSKEVVPVLGKIDLLVYAKGSDITANEGYANNNKYNVLYQEGFRYFVSSANVPWAEVTNEYVRQSRIMVTGGTMLSTPSTYASYFDAAAVLNELRGK